MIMPSTGFSHGVVHFWHMCQKIFLPISLVCQRCPVLVFFLNVIYLKWCRLTALMPPKKFWHTCVKIFLACFCVSEIFTHRNRPHKKFATFFGGTTLALSHFLLSLSLSICGLLAPLPRSYAPIAHPSFFDVSSHVLHINLPVIPSPSPAHISVWKKKMSILGHHSAGVQKWWFSPVFSHNFNFPFHLFPNVHF